MHQSVAVWCYPFLCNYGTRTTTTTTTTTTNIITTFTFIPVHTMLGSTDIVLRILNLGCR